MTRCTNCNKVIQDLALSIECFKCHNLICLDCTHSRHSPGSDFGVCKLCHSGLEERTFLVEVQPDPVTFAVPARTATEAKALAFKSCDYGEREVPITIDSAADNDEIEVTPC